MLRIKLMPFGRKHLHHYRIAVVEDREKLTGNPAAIIGTYEAKSKKLNLDADQAQAWIKKGAQPTDTIRKLLGL